LHFCPCPGMHAKGPESTVSITRTSPGGIDTSLPVAHWSTDCTVGLWARPPVSPSVRTCIDIYVGCYYIAMSGQLNLNLTSPPNWSDESILPPYPSNASTNSGTVLKYYLDLANTTQQHLDSSMKQLATKFSAAYLSAGAKSTNSATRKLLSQGNSAYMRSMVDLARASIVVGTSGGRTAIEDIVGEIRKMPDFSIVWENNRFQRPLDGYMDYQLNLKDNTNGMICELQIHLCPLVKFKESIGHKLYEITRDIKGKYANNASKATSVEQLVLEAITDLQTKAYSKLATNTNTSSAKCCINDNCLRGGTQVRRNELWIQTSRTVTVKGTVRKLWRSAKDASLLAVKRIVKAADGSKKVRFQRV